MLAIIAVGCVIARAARAEFVSLVSRGSDPREAPRTPLREGHGYSAAARTPAGERQHCRYLVAALARVRSASPHRSCFLGGLRAEPARSRPLRAQRTP